MMRVMVVDGGARGQAIGVKLAPECDELFISPGNPGNEDFAVSTGVAPTDVAGQLDVAKREQIDLTIVGADDPLALGIVDVFKHEELAIFGPTRTQARIEADREFAKTVSQRYRAPIGRYAYFTDRVAACAYAETRQWPLFVKDNGLAQGKGAIKCETLEDFERAAHKLGGEIIVEDFVAGPEASHHAFCDGKYYLPFPYLVRDHKTIGEDGTGPMTGGMGVVGPLPGYQLAEVEALSEKFVWPVVRKLGFSGILFSGLKGDKGEEKLLEWNARPGDPEMQVFLKLMKSELLPILWACVEGKLSEVKTPEWQSGQSVVSLVLAAEGYPGEARKGMSIEGLEAAKRIYGINVLHAATQKKRGQLVTDGGRVLNVISQASSLEIALHRAYEAAERITFAGRPPVFRRDIGQTALLGY